MKRIVVAFIFGTLLFGNAANATLIDRGGGLIYDTDLDVTWLQDANYARTSGHDTDGRMNWYDAKSWVDNLLYQDVVRGVSWDDWRLPKALPVNDVFYTYVQGYDGSKDWGFNISAPGSLYDGSTNNEMAYMYYNNMNNLGWYDLSGNHRSIYGLQNAGPFNNIQATYYWSGDKYTPN